MPPAICPSFQRLSGLLWSVLTWRHILSKLSFLLAFSEPKRMCELHVVSAKVPVWSFRITIATVSLLIYAPLLGGTGFSPQLFVDESSLIHFVMYSLCASSWIGKKRKGEKRKAALCFPGSHSLREASYLTAVNTMGGGGYYVGALLPRTEVSYTRNAPDVQLAYGPLFCEGYLSSCWLAMATDVY